MSYGLRVSVVAAALGLLAALAWIRFGPIPGELLDQSRYASATVVDRHGVILYEPLSAAGTRGERVGALELPPQIVAATIAAEDRRFFDHPGIDPIAIVRAAIHDVRHLGVVEGGSTLTQQVAKLLLQSTSRSPLQKGRETLLALRLEHRFTKNEILAMYLDLAPYGNRINGISRASRTYFGWAPGDLTIPQAAFLASLPQRPSAFNPLRDGNRARARQLYVLRQMREAKLVTSVEHEHARAERLRFVRDGQPLIAQHFVERVLERRDSATLDCGTLQGPSRCTTIRTSLDSSLQHDVQGIIAAQRDRLIQHGATAVAVAVLDNRTGEWLAWEGSGDYFGSSFGGAIDGVVSPRQPGSTLKPFTYALAFENGASPATVLPDIASSFPTAEEGVVYTPRNYDGRYRGPLRVRAALAGSENVPAVAMASRLGPASLLRFLRAAGFTTLKNNTDYYGLGLTLGDAEVRLDELVAAYAAIARGGTRVQPTFFAVPPHPAFGHLLPAAGGEKGNIGTSRKDRVCCPSPRDSGERVPKAGEGREQGRLMSQRSAFWLADILSDTQAREFVFGTGGSLDFPFRVAAKTGTSQAYRDNWTVGFTRDITVGVWVGNFNRRELRNSSGVTGAAPIFNAVMLAATKRLRGSLPIGDDAPIVAPPDDVEIVQVCTLSGLRPSPYCPAVQSEWVSKKAPAAFCSWHHDGYVDWPAEYRGWAKSVERRPSPPHAAAASRAEFRVTNPADGSTYLIDPTLRSGFQKLPLRAVALSAVTWRVDGRAVGTAGSDAALEWPLAPGAHTITAADQRGQRDSVRIWVK